MEHLLDELAERGISDRRYHRLLDALRPAGAGQEPQITLPELLKAKHESRLSSIAASIDDPALGSAVEEFARTVSDYETKNGLRILLELAPPRSGGRKTRLSYLRSAKNIIQLAHEAERPTATRPQGRRRNTVHRYLLTSISKLLVFHLGQAKRNEIFADVRYARQDDARDVHLSPSEIAHLLTVCQAVDRRMTEHWAANTPLVVGAFPALVRLALVTGADRAPLLRLQAKDVQLVAESQGGRMRGTIYLRDKKTDTRPRTVAVTDAMCRVLLPLLHGKAPAEAVFQMTKRQIQQRWEQSREAFGMPRLRFKDLRHQFGGYGDKAGLSLSELAGAMGHTNRATTMRYAVHTAVLDDEAAEKVEREMGLAAPAAHGAMHLAFGSGSAD